MKNETEKIQQIKAIAELSPCGVGVFDIETSSPIFLNRAYYSMVGYTQDEYEMLFRYNNVLMYPQDISVLHQCKSIFSTTGEAKDCEYRIVRKDGRIRWVKLNASTIEIDGAPYAYAVFTDITSDKESHAQMEIIEENTNIGISVISVRNGIEEFVYANEYFFSLTGVSRDEYEKNMRDIDISSVSSADRVRLTEAKKEAVAKGQAGKIEYQLIRPDGKRRWVSRQYRSIKQENSESDILISGVTDITESKETEIKTLMLQKRLQMVANAFGAAVFEWNLKNGNFYSSEAYKNYAISVLHPGEIFERSDFSDFVYPDDHKKLLGYFKKSNSGKEKAEATLRMKMTDGSYRWCHIIGFFYSDESGKLTRVICVLLDVNDEHEHSFIVDNILNAMPGGVGIIGLGEKIICEYYSDGFARLGGYTREQMDELIKTDNFLELLVAPMDFQRFSSTIKKNSAKGQPININFRIINQDNGISWLHLAASKMRDKEGVPFYYCVFTKPSEETAMYRKVVEDSAVGVFVGERASRTALFVNSTINEICGFSSPSFGEGDSSLENMSHNYEQHLLTQKQIYDLQIDTYSEYHIAYNKRYLSIRAKAIIWHGVDAYILYVSDETAEHENQMRLQKLIDGVPGGIGIFDIIDGKIKTTYLNDAYFDMLGITRNSYSKYYEGNVLEAVYEDDRAAILSGIKNLFAGKDRSQILLRVCNGEGKWVWLNLEVSVVERDARHIRIYIAYSDCDELVRTQEALKIRYDDQVRFAEMVASTSVASSMLNLTKHTVTLQNKEKDGFMTDVTDQTPKQSFEEMYQYIPDEEIRQNYMDIFNEDRIIADFGKGIESKSLRYPYIDVGCWYESTYNAVRNPKTNDLEVYFFVRDVSHEIQEEEISRKVMAQSYDEFILIDSVTGEPYTLAKNVDSDIYEEQRRQGDYSLGLRSYILKHSADENPEEIAESLGLKAVNQALQTQDSYTVMYSLYNRKNKIARRSATYSYLNKYKTKLFCAIQDITSIFEKDIEQQKKLQAALAEAKKASRAKSDFYSRMSHDMRTPMNCILGMAELSNDETDSEKIKTYIKKIHESGEYLLSLINDTLDVQRIESGKLVIEPQIVNSQGILENVMDMIRASADKKEITLRYTSESDLNRNIRVDPLRLKQIFINLLSNAVKFTPVGGMVEMEFKFLSREGMISHDVIYVRDTGMGMGKDFLQDGIFKPFSQENSNVSMKYSGSGLGLSIAKSLIELMGGKIEVESELGVGTTFIVYLDFELVDDTTAKMAENNKIIEKKDFKSILHGKNVLFVEDHHLNAEIGKKLLERVGCNVDWVENGQDAVNRFDSMPAYSFDVILMDIRMPVMDGLEATQCIRALNKCDASEIPIIAMTANAGEEDVKASLEAGMNAHLGKPIQPAILYEKLSEFISDNKDKPKKGKQQS